VTAPESSAAIETFDQLAEKFDAGIIRYFLLNRPACRPIVFDPATARRHSRSNPFWNVQYAHARIAAIERYAAGQGIGCDPGSPLTTLTSPDELALIRTIVRLPETSARAVRECEPYVVCNYLGLLADAIHQLLDSARIIAAPPYERNARLRLLAVTKRILHTQLEVLGIVAADRI
jgi:arginyl-tRNA synthetase